jgi:hypothetical protein
MQWVELRADSIYEAQIEAGSYTDYTRRYSNHRICRMRCNCTFPSICVAILHPDSAISSARDLDSSEIAAVSAAQRDVGQNTENVIVKRVSSTCCLFLPSVGML